MGTFTLKDNASRKVYSIGLEGTFSNEDGFAYIEAYKKGIAKIRPADYVLELDCRKLDIGRAETMDTLKDIYKMYIADGFPKVIFVLDQSKLILKMQLARIAQETGLPNYELQIL